VTVDPAHLAEVARRWDAAADRYLELFRHELDGKPHDLAALSAFAARVGPGGRVCDAGCGPCGHVARRLGDAGLEVLGVDLSPRCVALARLEQPGLRFEPWDMGALPLPDGALDGLVAFYALHDQPRATLPAVLAEWARAVRPGGQLLLVAKEGVGEGWIEDPLGTGLRAWWTAFSPGELAALARGAGFEEVALHVREPQPDEIAARRISLTGRRG